MQRCLSLAGALRDKVPVAFVLDVDHDPHWSGRVQSHGYNVLSESEARKVEPKWVLLDGYNFSDNDFETWGRFTSFIIAIRDDNESPSPCDLIIRTGISGQASGQDVGQTMVLSGLSYSMVDPAFGKARDRKIADRVNQLLISFGYRDSNNATLSVLEAICTIDSQGFRPNVLVVLGPKAPHRDEISTFLQARFGARGRLLLGVDNMSELLHDCDLVIGGGGVSALERAASGTPSLTIAIAGNQEPTANLLHEAGATWCLGSLEQVNHSALVQALQKMTSDKALRRCQSEAGPTIIDGKGVFHIARAILTMAKV